MSKDDSEHRTNGLDDVADDAAHPFDQTNGMVDGLEGDADAPEHAESVTGEGETAYLAAPSPGTQMAPGVIPAGAVDPAERESKEDSDTDDPTPA